MSRARYVNAGSNSLWIDPSAFAQPTGARFGTCGPNSVRGPGLFNLDMWIFGKLQISEGMTLQFRAEGLNMTNTPHFERPNSRNVNSGTFMVLNRIRNTGRERIDERFFRIGLRLGWQASRHPTESNHSRAALRRGPCSCAPMMLGNWAAPSKTA